MHRQTWEEIFIFFHFSYHFINKEQTSIEKKMILQKLELLSRVVDNIFWNENADNLKN